MAVSVPPLINAPSSLPLVAHCVSEEGGLHSVGLPSCAPLHSFVSREGGGAAGRSERGAPAPPHPVRPPVPLPLLRPPEAACVIQTCSRGGGRIGGERGVSFRWEGCSRGWRVGECDAPDPQELSLCPMGGTADRLGVGLASSLSSSTGSMDYAATTTRGGQPHPHCHSYTS